MKRKKIIAFVDGKRLLDVVEESVKYRTTVEKIKEEVKNKYPDRSVNFEVIYE